MRNDEFELFLSMLARLDVEQKDRLESTLAAGDDETAVIELLESRLVTQPACLIVGPGARGPGARAMGSSGIAARPALAPSTH